MADFFSTAEEQIDFDRAASAFPDISLDGDGDIPLPPQTRPVAQNASVFSFDQLDNPKSNVVKVTGDDDIEKFESEFPDIDVGQVCTLIVQTRML